jgi:hypothetical protein
MLVSDALRAKHVIYDLKADASFSSRVVSSGAFALNASCESILTGLSVIGSLAPASVKFALESTGIDLNPYISEKYRFSSLWKNVNQAGNLALSVIFVSPAIFLGGKEWASSIFTQWVEPITIKKAAKISHVFRGFKFPTLYDSKYADCTHHIWRLIRRNPLRTMGLFMVSAATAGIGIRLYPKITPSMNNWQLSRSDQELSENVAQENKETALNALLEKSSLELIDPNEDNQNINFDYDEFSNQITKIIIGWAKAFGLVTIGFQMLASILNDEMLNRIDRRMPEVVLKRVKKIRHWCRIKNEQLLQKEAERQRQLSRNP